jgi:hypothetical protein
MHAIWYAITRPAGYDMNSFLSGPGFSGLRGGRHP